jgi:hypothetical protein
MALAVPRLDLSADQSEAQQTQHNAADNAVATSKHSTSEGKPQGLPFAAVESCEEKAGQAANGCLTLSRWETTSEAFGSPATARASASLVAR